MRNGIGFDIHKLEQGRPLVIGGVTIPHDKGPEGDSDADVLTHAVIDALLGAKALGDIGSYFGVGTPEVMGSRSVDMLSVLLTLDTYKIANIDATLIAQEPKMTQYRDEIRQNLSLVLELPVDRISVKFTTPKHIGSLGAGDGIACICIATLED